MKTLSSLLLLTIVFGCAPTFAADQGKTSKTVTPKISKEKAREVALNLVPGDVVRWDLEIQEGNPSFTYYIRSKDGRISEVAIDGKSGKKDHIGIELEYGSSDGKSIKTSNPEDLPRWKEAKLSKDKAQVYALKAYPGTVEAFELLIWAVGAKGKLVYEYRIVGKDGKKMICVDSNTGAILASSIYADGG